MLKWYILLVLLTVPSVLGVNAVIRENSNCLSNEICFGSMFQRDNSHFSSDCSYYNYSICIPVQHTGLAAVTLRDSCNSDESFLLSLHQEHNTHISTADYYNYSLCGKNLEVAETCTGTTPIGVFSHYQESNSHIGSWDYYSHSFCLIDMSTIGHQAGKIAGTGDGLEPCEEGFKNVDGMCVKKTLEEKVIEIATIKGRMPWWFIPLILLVLMIVLFNIYWESIREKILYAYLYPFETQEKIKKSVADWFYGWFYVLFGKKKKKKREDEE